MFRKILNIFNVILINHSKYLFATAIIDKLFFLALFVLIARKLNIEHYGAVVTFSAIAQIYFQIVELGFSNYSQRSLSRDQLPKEQILTLLNTRILISLPVLLIPNFYLGFADKDQYYFIFMFSVFIYLNFINTLFFSFYLGRNNYRKYFYFFLRNRIPHFALLIVLQFKILSLLNFQIFVTLTSLSMLIYEWFIVKEYFSLEYRFGISIKLLAKTLRVSLPMWLGLIAVKIYDRIDIVFIENIIGVKSVAIYSVAYSLYKLPQIFSSSILTPTFIRFSKEFHTVGKINLYESKKILVILLSFSLMYFLLMYFTGKIIIINLWGFDFQESYKILLLLNVGLPFLLLNNFSGVILNSANQEKLAMFAAIFSATLGLVLYPITIHYFNVLGAIYTTILIEFIVFVIQLFFILKRGIL